jgi:hypothetical protein
VRDVRTTANRSRVLRRLPIRHRAAMAGVPGIAGPRPGTCGPLRRARRWRRAAGFVSQPAQRGHPKSEQPVGRRESSPQVTPPSRPARKALSPRLAPLRAPAPALYSSALAKALPRRPPVPSYPGDPRARLKDGSPSPSGTGRVGCPREKAQWAARAFSWGRPRRKDWRIPEHISPRFSAIIT